MQAHRRLPGWAQVGHEAALSAYWFSMNLQTASMVPIVLPVLLLKVLPSGQTQALGRLAAASSALALVVPVVAGSLSDRLRQEGRRRHPVILLGTAANLVGLFVLLRAQNWWTLALGYLTTSLGRNVAMGAYQALLPDLVPPEQWGSASGYMGVSTLAGTVAGLALAGLWGPQTAILLMGLTTLAGYGVTWRWVPEEEGIPWAQEPPPAPSSRRPAFAVAFVARFLVMLGLSLLMTFVLYFFRNVLGVQRPSLATAGTAVVALTGSLVSTFVMGWASDRLPRRYVVAASTLPMAAAAAAFALDPKSGLLPAAALLYGLGYGAFLSADWAFGLETMPRLSQAGRNLGVWDMAVNLPSILAPLLGSLVLTSWSLPLAVAYRDLFLLASASFLLGGAASLAAGRTAPSWWLGLFRYAVALGLAAYVRVGYRVQVEGELPREEGLVVVSNHVQDLETMVLPAYLQLALGFRRKVYAAGSQRMFEPGFLRERMGATGPLGRVWNLLPMAALSSALGVLPIENEPRHRPLRSWAYEVYVRHGDLFLHQVFSPTTLQACGLPSTGPWRLSSLWTTLFSLGQRPASHRALALPYREELRQSLRARVEEQLARLEEVVAQGGVLYLTPEGQMTASGRLSRLREALERTQRRAAHTVLASLSYDPFLPGRLRLYVRLRELGPGQDLRQALLAGRTITVSQLLAAFWARTPGRPFSPQEAQREVERALASLPPGAYVEARLAQNPGRQVRQALAALRRRGALRPSGEGLHATSLVLAGPVQDRRFPLAADLVAHQAQFLEQTLKALKEASLASPTGAKAPRP